MLYFPFQLKLISYVLISSLNRIKEDKCDNVYNYYMQWEKIELFCTNNYFFKQMENFPFRMIKCSKINERE